MLDDVPEADRPRHGDSGRRRANYVMDESLRRYFNSVVEGRTDAAPAWISMSFYGRESPGVAYKCTSLRTSVLMCPPEIQSAVELRDLESVIAVLSTRSSSEPMSAVE